MGTPDELVPIAEKVLSWVAVQRDPGQPVPMDRIDKDTIRRIELCALATREAAMFHTLYGGEKPCRCPGTSYPSACPCS